MRSIRRPLVLLAGLFACLATGCADPGTPDSVSGQQTATLTSTRVDAATVNRLRDGCKLQWPTPGLWDNL